MGARLLAGLAEKLQEAAEKEDSRTYAGLVEKIEEQCANLVKNEQFVKDSGMEEWPDGALGGRYRFQHALYQQVLYEQLGTARRAQLHRRIGTRLEAGYGTRAGEIAAPAGQSVGAARRAQPGAALAGARQTSGRARPARTGLRLVH